MISILKGLLIYLVAVGIGLVILIFIIICYLPIAIYGEYKLRVPKRKVSIFDTWE